MTYIPFHRKYRPKTFNDIVGQGAQILILKKSVQLNKLSPVLLFAGERGTGKTSTARVIAKVLNCPNVKNEEPCNDCKVCQAIDEGRFLDVIELDAGSYSTVDRIQTLIETVKYPVRDGKVKVYIIDECHNLSKRAWDVFLKTIEEPVTKIQFIFCTTALDKVPDTVKSRCQTYYFKPISEAEIVQRLKYVCQKENVQIDEIILKVIAKKSKGAIRDALNLLEQYILLDDKEMMKFLGYMTKGQVEHFLKLIINQDFPGAVKYAEKIMLPFDTIVESCIDYLTQSFVRNVGYANTIDAKLRIEILKEIASWKCGLSKTLDKQLFFKLHLLLLIEKLKGESITKQDKTNYSW